MRLFHASLREAFFIAGTVGTHTAPAHVFGIGFVPNSTYYYMVQMNIVTKTITMRQLVLSAKVSCDFFSSG